MNTLRLTYIVGLLLLSALFLLTPVQIPRKTTAKPSTNLVANPQQPIVPYFSFTKVDRDSGAVFPVYLKDGKPNAMFIPPATSLNSADFVPLQSENQNLNLVHKIK